MFKKGQLVRSTLRHLYVVVENGESFVKVRSISLGHHDQILGCRLRLVGNNYQAKPKCSR